MKEELFLPDGVARMSDDDDAGTKHWFAKGDNDEGVHVSSCAISLKKMVGVRRRQQP
jgi:hypothetical protein